MSWFGDEVAMVAASGALAARLSPRTVFVLAGGVGLLAPVLLGGRVVRAARSEDQADSAAMTPTPAAAA